MNITAWVQDCPSVEPGWAGCEWHVWWHGSVSVSQSKQTLISLWCSAPVSLLPCSLLLEAPEQASLGDSQAAQTVSTTPLSSWREPSMWRWWLVAKRGAATLSCWSMMMVRAPVHHWTQSRQVFHSESADHEKLIVNLIMTVETSTVTSAVPPKKREYCDYPVQSSPSMSDNEESSVKPPVSPVSPVSPAAMTTSDLHHAMVSKTGPLRSSGFMITDILSGAASAGLPLPLGLPQVSLASLHHQHRVPSPHNSSDAGSNDNDISDEEGKQAADNIVNMFGEMLPTEWAKLNSF